ncbi:hypothetical protein EX30DRAFT_394003 [Ascodesmis nigricans]|uniref:Uncharacterized protein n=1 Tax=Ascodesmis nigricans TaxID=341454 RepID=A0A4S2N119_9PEZI|nr:hypothetical protein EX30DRAFT_394003 [Ascodesmis nigricans]
MIPSILRHLPTPLRRVHKITKKLQATQTSPSNANPEPDKSSAAGEGEEQPDDFDKVEQEEVDAFLGVNEWDLVERVDIGYKRSGFSAYDRGLREGGKGDEVKWVVEDGKLVGSVQ